MRTIKSNKKLTKEEIAEYLKYEGPVFLNIGKYNEGAFMFEVKSRNCRKCKKVTKHEWVRDLDICYWRCEECLENMMKTEGLYVPPHVENPIKYGLRVGRWGAKY